MTGFASLIRQLAELSLVLSFSAAAAPQTIKPAQIWPDDRGQHIQAHGGGMLKWESSYYWFGEDRSQGPDRDKRYISCYASTDLAHWSFRNDVINISDPENLGRGWVLERPKVFYNPNSKTFVMYMHIDDGQYGLAHVGVATFPKHDAPKGRWHQDHDGHFHGRYLEAPDAVGFEVSLDAAGNRCRQVVGS